MKGRPPSREETRTLQIGTLLLPEARARLLHPGRKRYLDVLGHDLLRPRHGAGVLGLADHGLDALDAPVAVVEPARDVLRQLLDIPLLGLLGALVVEAGQHMLLVQPLELLRLLGDVGEQVRHLVRDVGPARGQQVHLDHGVAVVVVVAARQEAAPVRGLVGGEEHGGAGGGAEALGAGEVVATAILVPVGRVVSVGLPVGEIAAGRSGRSEDWVWGRGGCCARDGQREARGRRCDGQGDSQVGPVSPHGGRRGEGRLLSGSVWPLGRWSVDRVSVWGRVQSSPAGA